MTPGWTENQLHPGEHWLFYDRRGDYRARVDFQPWTNGLYMWRVMLGWPKNEIVGWEETLQTAQTQAEKIMNGQPCQLSLPIPKGVES